MPRILLFLLLTLPVWAGCRAPAVVPATPQGPVEVTMLPLEGDFSQAEFSGLAWYGDWLVLLPQYPERFAPPDAASGEGRLFALHRRDVLAVLDDPEQGPLRPREIPFFATGIAELTPGFDGFEAIAFRGDEVFVTVEEQSSQGEMSGSLVQGRIEPDLGRVVLDASSLTPLPQQISVPNMAYEALVMADDVLYALYESNGSARRVFPTAAQFLPGRTTPLLQAFPHIEYRITDATDADRNGRFWAINYYFPGDSTRLQPRPDPLSERQIGPQEGVERLVEFQVERGRIMLTGRPPLDLQLDPSGALRNWEGIVRLEERGFLIVTDLFPRTLLGFVPFP